MTIEGPKAMDPAGDDSLGEIEIQLIGGHGKMTIVTTHLPISQIERIQNDPALLENLKQHIRRELERYANSQ